MDINQCSLCKESFWSKNKLDRHLRFVTYVLIKSVPGLENEIVYLMTFFQSLNEKKKKKLLNFGWENLPQMEGAWMRGGGVQFDSYFNHLPLD